MAIVGNLYDTLTVGSRRRPLWYPPSVGVPYPSPMGDGQSAAEDWPTYLKRMTSRSGWSVARLAREAGIHRATIFGWISGDSGVMVANVIAIARALGDDPANALLAAGAVDPPNADEDANVRLIMEAPVTEEVRQRMLARYRARLAAARTALAADMAEDLKWLADQQKQNS